MAQLYTRSYFKNLAKNASRQANMTYERLIQRNNQGQSFDIFLSHSSLDKETVLGIAIELQKLGYTSYIYWVVDAHMTKREVDKNTALNLKRRMNMCDCLFYATTQNHHQSKWMPWELGYMDGRKSRCAILPMTEEGYKSSYAGQEYLSVYPYVVKEQRGASKGRLWICDDHKSCVLFKNWKVGSLPQRGTYPL